MKGDKVTWIKIYDENLERESRKIMDSYGKGIHRSIPKNTF